MPRLLGAGHNNNKREAATICPALCDLDLLTLKVVSESRVTWATSANFSLPRTLCSRRRPEVCDTDRCQTDRRQTSDSIID